MQKDKNNSFKEDNSLFNRLPKGIKKQKAIHNKNSW